MVPTLAGYLKTVFLRLDGLGFVAFGPKLNSDLQTGGDHFDRVKKTCASRVAAGRLLPVNTGPDDILLDIFLGSEPTVYTCHERLQLPLSVSGGGFALADAYLLMDWRPSGPGIEEVSVPDGLYCASLVEAPCTRPPRLITLCLNQVSALPPWHGRGIPSLLADYRREPSYSRS